MKSKIKAVVKKFLGTGGLKKINYARNYRLLAANSIEDFKLYLKHSTVFNQDGLHKIECQLILDYHSVEKGLLFKKPSQDLLNNAF